MLTSSCSFCRTPVSSKLGGYFGGGGYSTYFTAPLYQKLTTLGYSIKLGKTNFGFYNPLNRGYPDVSAQGSRFLVRTGGRVSFKVVEKDRDSKKGWT